MERVNNFKVNILNKNSKECWKYCITIERAVNLRDIGKQQGLNSVIFGIKHGKWVAV
jgi:hypothetical protein